MADKFKVEAAAQPQANPYVPPGPPEPQLFEEFMGIDTATTRPGVNDKQMAWCDGFMPLARMNLRTMYGVGPPIYVEATKVISFFDFANIGATPYCIVINTDGSIRAINTITLGDNEIAPAGTIQNASRLTVGLTQSGSSAILIVCQQPNGYFVWDGTIFYQAGSLALDVTILNSGSGYTVAPNVTAFGGTGSGITFSATVAGGIVTNVAITNPGTGYGANDYVGVAFNGGGSTGATGIVLATMAAGTIASVSVSNVGAGYVSPIASVLGGGGTGASITLGVSSGTISGATVAAAGSGYLSNPTVIITDAANPVASAVVTTMPFGIQGTSIETYVGRVWISNGPQVTFTAPGSITDFSTAAGGGNFISTDSFLRVGYTQLKQTNGFLYLIADSSINYISGVTTSGSPPTTTFTNQNADPEVGTPWPSTVTVYGRNIIFANSFGAHISYGAAVTKISEPLDGVYNSVPNFGSFVPSSAKAIIFGKKVWMLLLPIIDPISGQQVNKLFFWKGEKLWWASGQDVPLIYIQSQEINSVLTAYGTDGSSIYPLFQQPSSAFAKIAQSKFWAQPGGYMLTKATSRLWGLTQYYSLDHANLDISIDNENSSAVDTFVLGPPVMNWKTQTGAAMNWTTQTGAAMVWTSAGIAVLAPQAVGQVGKLIGLTVETQAVDMALISLAIHNEIVAYRG